MKPIIQSTFVVIAVAIVGFGQAPDSSSSMAMLEGMLPADGATVLMDKGCTSCHSFDGWGGMFGPDLGANRVRGASPSSLAAAMWNHAPSMWRSIGAGEVPALNPKEAAALFAFLYSRLYFESYPNSPNGEDVFTSRCSGCHDLKASPSSQKPGPPVATWQSIKDPIALASRMWSHSADMLDQALRQGRSWPRLSGGDMRDLVAYLWRLPELRSVKAAFRFGNDVNGRGIFNEQCGRCHALDRKEAGRIDLSEKIRRMTMLELAASMWNHAPSMKRKEPGSKLPKLDETQTRDLVTYLVVGRAFRESGDQWRGRLVFEAKKCVSCHEGGAAKSGAPPLSSLRGPFNPVRMTSVLWSHGPKMMDVMKRENIRWPRFEGPEMLHLLAYLNEKAGK